VIRGEKPKADDDEGGPPEPEVSPSLTALPKTKIKSPKSGGMEPEPT
jgi:cell division protease FtsH